MKFVKFLYVAIIINSFPASVTSAPFDINLTINGAKSGTNYLRAEIYKDGTSDYYGETYNGRDWYGGSEGKNYFPVQISSSNSSFTIKARVSGIKDLGSYKLKIKRYTASGNAASDEEKEADIQIANNSTPTPEAIVTPEIKPETIIPSPQKTPVKTAKAIAKIEPKNTGAVLSQSTQIPVPAKNKSDNFNLFAATIFATGLFLLGIPILLFVRKRIDRYN